MKTIRKLSFMQRIKPGEGEHVLRIRFVSRTVKVSIGNAVRHEKYIKKTELKR